MAMTLTLVAVSLNDQPLSQPITAVFDARGGTIGRADHNTMALPDPQRHVSRLQAEVVAHDQGFVIRNVGSANPIVVGTRSLGGSDTHELAHGDTLRIGPYVLKVQISTAHSEAPTRPGLQRLASAPTPARQASVPVAGPTAPAPLSGNAFADLLGSGGGGGSVSSDNPFADLLGAPAPPPSAAPLRTPAPVDPFADLMPPPAGVAARSPALAPQPPPAARLPDDFDPFAAPAAKPVAGPAAPVVDPFADLMPQAAAPSIDAMFGIGSAAPASKDDPLAHFISGGGTTRGSRRGRRCRHRGPLAPSRRPAHPTTSRRRRRCGPRSAKAQASTRRCRRADWRNDCARSAASCATRSTARCR